MLCVQEYIMNKLQKQVEKLGSEKGALQRERSDLQRQCGELAGAVDKLNKDKVCREGGRDKPCVNKTLLRGTVQQGLAHGSLDCAHTQALLACAFTWCAGCTMQLWWMSTQ